MAGTAIYTRPNFGIPGHLSRPEQAQDIGTIFLSSTIPPAAFGAPFKLASGVAAKIETNDAATEVAGFLVRSTVEHMPTSNQALSTTTPNPAYHHGWLKRGYMYATCLGATAPDIDVPVYVRVRDNGSTSRAIGSLEAAAGTKVGTVGAVTGTGNGTFTMASPSTSAGAKIGAWKVVCIEPATDAGTFQVFDPDGNLDGVATVGVAYAGNIKFTIADGSTDFTAGAHFTVTVVADCEAIPGAYWAGSRDSSNNAEIRYTKP
jgi:hypothetical protein